MSSPLHPPYDVTAGREERGSRHWLSGRLIFGLLLLAFGALWTLDNLDMLEAESVTRYWPALLLVWGLGMLVGLGCRRRPVGGLVWTVIGSWLLLWELEIVDISLFDLWPLILIFVGGTVIYHAWRGRSYRAVETDRDQHLNVFVVMGGTERKVIAETFEGGEINTVMGGADIDLRSAKIGPRGARIDLFALFGGIDLIVPEGWRVIGEVTPLLGGFENSTHTPIDPSAPTLTVRGLVVMGGVEVKHSDEDEPRHERRHRHATDEVG